MDNSRNPLIFSALQNKGESFREPRPTSKPEAVQHDGFFVVSFFGSFEGGSTRGKSRDVARAGAWRRFRVSFFGKIVEGSVPMPPWFATANRLACWRGWIRLGWYGYWRWSGHVVGRRREAAGRGCDRWKRGRRACGPVRGIWLVWQRCPSTDDTHAPDVDPAAALTHGRRRPGRFALLAVLTKVLLWRKTSLRGDAFFW